jgi:hypothetical protein
MGMGTRCRALQCSALRFGKLPLKAFPYTQRAKGNGRGKRKRERVIGERERKVRNIGGRERESSDRHGKKRKRRRELGEREREAK